MATYLQPNDPGEGPDRFGEYGMLFLFIAVCLLVMLVLL